MLQYIYDKYGRDRAGMTAEVITYRERSAVRDVGKALGLSLDRVDALAKAWTRPARDEDRARRAGCREAGLDPDSRVWRAAGLARRASCSASRGTCRSTSAAW